VEYLKMNGCQVEVITFGKSASGKLKESADDFIDLDEDAGRYVLSSGVYSNNRRDNRTPHADRAPRQERSERAERPERKERPNDGKIGGMRKVIRKMQ